MRFAIILLLSGLLWHPMGYTQSSQPAVTLDSIRSAYETLQYQSAIELSDAYLSAHPRLPKYELVTALQYRAFSQMALGKEDEARNTLRSALVADPDFTLDRQIASPKIVRIFNEVRSNIQSGSMTLNEQGSPVILEDRKTNAVLRSALFPGLGQIYLQQPRGYMYSAVGVLSMGTLLVSAYRVPTLRENYLRATDTDVIQTRYDAYNQWYQLRNTAGIIALLSWSVSLSDVLLFAPDHPAKLSLIPRESGFAMQIALQW